MLATRSAPERGNQAERLECLGLYEQRSDRLLLLFWLIKTFPLTDPASTPASAAGPSTPSPDQQRRIPSPHLTGTLLGSQGITSRCLASDGRCFPRVKLVSWT